MLLSHVQGTSIFLRIMTGIGTSKYMEYPSRNKSMHAIEKLKEVLCSEVNIKSVLQLNDSPVFLLATIGTYSPSIF